MTFKNKTGSQDMVLDLNFFDMKKIGKDSIVVAIGKRGSGKSFLIKDILYHKRDIPLGMVVSHTNKMNHFYDEFIPNMFVYDKYSPEIIGDLFKRQGKALQEKWKDPFSFLLLDDCLSDAKSWVKDDNIKEIFFNGRWYKIMFILALQSPRDNIPPSFRTNIDFTFILKNNNLQDREILYRNYAGMFRSREIFEHVLDACTEDNHCLVIDNTTNSNKFEDQVFIYKAENHPDFKMCSDKLWRINDKKYNKERKVVNIDEDVREIRTKSSKITIRKKMK